MLNIKVAITLPVIEKYVLMMALYWLLPAANAPLKLGQNSHKNKVPIVNQQKAMIVRLELCQVNLHS